MARERIGHTQLANTISALLKSDQRDEIRWIYDALSVLDTKASGLLSFNGILIALTSALLGFVLQTPISGYFYPVLVGGGLAACVVSSLFCIRVLWIGWDFLGNVSEESSDGNLKYDFNVEVAELVKVLQKRTRHHHLAVSITLWDLAFMAFCAVWVIANRI